MARVDQLSTILLPRFVRFGQASLLNCDSTVFDPGRSGARKIVFTLSEWLGSVPVQASNRLPLKMAIAGEVKLLSASVSFCRLP